MFVRRASSFRKIAKSRNIGEGQKGGALSNAVQSRKISAALRVTDLIKPAVRFDAATAVIAYRGQDGTEDQHDDQTYLPQGYLLFLDRLAYAAMNALAQIGGQRFAAQPATGKLNVGTRHQYPLDIAELLSPQNALTKGNAAHNDVKKPH